MKRIVAVVLVLVILLTGCQSKPQKNQGDSSVTNNSETVSTGEDNTPEEETPSPVPDKPADEADTGILQLDASWTSVQSIKPVGLEYTTAEYSARGTKIQHCRRFIPTLRIWIGFQALQKNRRAC